MLLLCLYTSQAQQHLRHKGKLSSAQGGTCATAPELVPERIRAMVSAPIKDVDGIQSADTITLDVAVECDGDLALELGSVDAARAYVLRLFSAASAVYERELNVRLRISSLRVWKPDESPYDRETSVYGLLNEFVERYEATMSGVERDLAVIVTARGGEGGVARSIGGLCEKGASYCAIDVYGIVEEYPTWTWDAQVLCHEIGHICGGIHTQSCYWTQPLDSCITSESGRCYSSEDVRPTRGTIMSYCHMQRRNGGISVLEFHPRQRPILRTYIEQALCNGTAPVRADTNALTVVVRDNSGNPLRGVALSLSVISDDLYRGLPPAPVPNTLITDAEGQVRFLSLGTALYTVSVSKPYIRITTSDYDDESFTITMVESSQSRLELTLAKAVKMRVTIDSVRGLHTIVLCRFKSAPDLRIDLDNAPTSDTTTTTVFERYVLPGSYVVAPSALGWKFSPATAAMQAMQDSAQVEVRFSADSTSKDVASVVVGSGIANRTSLPATQLVGGNAYTLYNEDTQQTIAQGIVPPSGVTVIDDVPAQGYYGVRLSIDTTTYAPWYQQNDAIVPLYGQPSTLFVQRERKRPLLARTYQFSSTVETYKPLPSPSILQDPYKPFNAISTVDVPFTLPAGGQRISVHRNGFVTFGTNKLPLYTIYPLLMTDDVDAIVAPLGMQLVPDTNAPNPWHVGYSVQGASPSRMVVVEWQEFAARVYDPETGVAKMSGRFSFQLRIHENGTIEFIYQRPAAVTFPVTAHIGIRGADVLDNSVVSFQENSAREALAGFEYKEDHFETITELTDMPSGLVYRWTKQIVSVPDDAWESFNVTSTMDALHVTSSEPLGSIQVYSLIGELISEQHTDASRLAIPTRGMHTGMYTVVRTHGDGCYVRTIMHFVR